MKTIKLIKQDGYVFIASFGKKYEVTDEEYQKITSLLYNVKLEGNTFVFEDDAQMQEFLELENIEEIKAEKAKAIDKIASLSDQLNLTAGALDIVVDVLAQTNPEILEHPWIIESKAKLEAIKLILND